MISRRCVFILAVVVCLIAHHDSQAAPGRPLPAGVTRHAFGGLHPRVSPDGKQIVLSWRGAIWRMSIEGGTLTRLTQGEGFAVEPCWSPDGQHIVYLKTKNFGGGLLQRIRASDGQPFGLPKPAPANGKMYWHPDGRRILGKFITPAPERLEQLAWYDLQTGTLEVIEPLRITKTIRPRRRLPIALSRDGQTLYFATHKDRPDEQGGNDGHDADLYKLELSKPTAQPEHILNWPSRIYDMSATANGDAVFISTNRGGAYNDIWRVPLKDAFYRSKKITHGQADEDRPTPLADGSLIYTDNQNGPTSIVRHDLKTNIVTPIGVDRFDYGVDTGKIVIKIRESGSGAPTTASVSVKSMDGARYSPPGTLYREQAGVYHYYAHGQTVIEAPAGRYEIAVRRGPEYRPYSKTVDVVASQTTQTDASLERWTHPAQDGWYSGENHIHANYGYGSWYNTPPDVLDQCDGENLNVCNVMVANSDTDGVYDRLFFTGAPDRLSSDQTILYWNQEFRSTFWGHMTLINLEQLVEPIFTGFEGTTNPYDVPTNSDIAESTHHQQGLVSYTHPASNPDDMYLNPYTARGVPVDAALGNIDAMDVMGGGYLVGTQLWYKLLNCGFRLSAAAGTDCFLNRVSSRAPGWGRCYVKVDGPLDYRAWVEGLRAGRSFVSNGPILDMSVNGQPIGDTIEMTQPGKVRVRAQAKSYYPVDTIEVIHNGRVAASAKATDTGRTATIDQEVEVHTTGWIAVRVIGNQRPPYMPFPKLVAHASPVYINMPGKLQNAREDARYFLDWIDRHERLFIERDRAGHDKQRVLNLYDHARGVYRRILAR
ncbi:MAG: CehA/McbA family metallohydrolase [Planctomycetota bacterium]|jgi:Tol biopolymer transport system component